MANATDPREYPEKPTFEFPLMDDHGNGHFPTFKDRDERFDEEDPTEDCWGYDGGFGEGEL